MNDSIKLLSWDNGRSFKIELFGANETLSNVRAVLYGVSDDVFYTDSLFFDGKQAVFPLEGICKPVDKISIQLNFKDNSKLDVDLLNNLFPKNDREFEEKFIRKMQRHGSSSIDYFVADQIELFFDGAVYYSCSAAVVKAYKAVELNDDQLLRSAESGVNKALKVIDKADVHWHPRKNKEHLYFSMLCALWHVKLAQSDRSGFLDVLESVFSSSSDSALKNYFTPSYPISNALCLYAIFLSLTGQREKSKEVSELCFRVFQSAVKDADKNKNTLFEELAVSHRATAKALRISSEKALVEDPEYIKKSVYDLIRLNKKQHAGVCDALYEKFLKMARTH